MAETTKKQSPEAILQDRIKELEGQLAEKSQLYDTVTADLSTARKDLAESNRIGTELANHLDQGVPLVKMI